MQREFRQASRSTVQQPKKALSNLYSIAPDRTQCIAITATKQRTITDVRSDPSARRVGGDDHLATTPFEERVSNFEHAMMCMMEGYYRYNRQALVTSAHNASVNAQDLIILNAIHMHHRPKNIAEVCRFLNRDDIVNVQYSVRKMVKIGLVERASSAKTRTASYRTTPEGRDKVDQFVAWRRELLLSAVEALGPEIEGRLEDAAQLIWLMSGLYDQTARILSTRE